jgi:hypothetical protein
MRLMELIRRRGHWFLIGFLIIFTISLFFGLTAGFNGGIFNQAGAGGQAPDVKHAPVISTNAADKDTALLVNGRKVSNYVYNQIVKLYIDNYARNADDPTTTLTAYGYAVNILTGQEVLMAYGEEHGIKMTAADWDKAKADVSANLMPKENDKSGSLVKDALGSLNERKAQKAAFEQYLSMQGLSESQWEKDAQRDLYTRKVSDAIKEEVNSAKKAEVEKTKAKVDADLKAGKKFADIAKQYSDGSSASNGGDIDWVGRGLLDKDVTDKLFAVKTGEISDWIKIPAGWQKFQVYERQEAKGPEFEKQKADIIKQIRDEKKDQKYEPSAEEIGDHYAKVRARVIELHDADDMKSSQKIQDMVEGATVQINNPYALAYQALKDFKLQPMEGVTKDDLLKIAALAPVGEGYDWGVLNKKLAAGKPKADAKKDEAAEGADAADKTEAGKEGDIPDISGAAKMTDSAAKEEEKVMTPIYALAAGLIEKGIQDSNNAQDQFPMYMEAKILSDWLKDSAEANKQPVKTADARAQLEKLLVEVVKGNNYSANAHAMRGLNLARLDKSKEAGEELATAEKYAPAEVGDVWDTIKEGYKVLDNGAKVAEIEKKIQDLQQKQFQEMIQRQLQQQGMGGGGGQSVPIQIPAQ